MWNNIVSIYNLNNKEKQTVQILSNYYIQPPSFHDGDALRLIPSVLPARCKYFQIMISGLFLLHHITVMRFDGFLPCSQRAASTF
jgi:hypothetical protein